MSNIDAQIKEIDAKIQAVLTKMDDLIDEKMRLEKTKSQLIKLNGPRGPSFIPKSIYDDS